MGSGDLRDKLSRITADYYSGIGILIFERGDANTRYVFSLTSFSLMYLKRIWFKGSLRFCFHSAIGINYTV